MKTIILILTTIILLFSLQLKSKNLEKDNYFIENKGQWPDEVLFKSSIGGMTSWITKEGVKYDYFKTKINNNYNFLQNNLDDEFIKDKKIIRYGQVINVKLVGVNPNNKSKPKKKLKGYKNYFIGTDKNKWASKVSIYKEIIIENVYTGIDKRYYYDEGLLRYDFIAKPGADLSKIQMKLEGQDNFEINSNGELEILTSIGKITQGKIYAYQVENGNQIEITAKFINNESNIVSFELGEYNKDLALVIDPLSWSTFIGGSDGGEQVTKMIVDENNDIFFSGISSSNDFPTTTGAYNESNSGGGNDAVVGKLSSDGSTLIWATYIGGTGNDTGNSLGLTTDGDIVVTGYAQNDVPTTTGAYNETYNGGSFDIFISKISGDGSTLIWSTYVGGTSSDNGRDLVLNSNNDVFFAGDAQSTDFPVTGGAYDTGYNGNILDIVVGKLSNDGSTLEWATYLGGSARDESPKIALDDNEDVIISGRSASSNYPTTGGAYDTGYNGGTYDIVVSKLSNDGSSLLWSTFIGGSNEDGSSDLTLNENNDAIICGLSKSGNFPVTGGAYDTGFNSGSDVVVLKLSNDGTALDWATYLGGSSDDDSRGITLNEEEDIFVIGWTNSNNFPTTSGAYDETSNGDFDVFLSKLSSNGSSLLWSSYFGETGTDRGYSVTLDINKDLIIAGNSTSSNFPVTSGAFHETNNGSGDGFISKVLLTFPPEANQPTVTNITFTSALFNSIINSGNLSSTITFEYGTSSGDYSFVTNSEVISASNSNVNVSISQDNLSPGTQYFLVAKVENSNSFHYSSEVSFSTLVPDDIDSDGVLNEVENAAPNNGDANFDGILDSEQSNVTSLLSNYTYVTIEIIGCDSIYDVSEKTEFVDNNFVFPLGQMEFKLPCSNAIVKIYFHSETDLSSYTYRKKFPDNTYKQFENAIFSTETIGGNQVAVVTLLLTDGGPGDYDGIVNGVIYDPGGPALPITANIPIWDWWWVLIIIPSTIIIYKFN